MKKKLLLALALASSVHAQTQQAAWLYQDIAPAAYIRIPQTWTFLLAKGANDPAALHSHWTQVQSQLARLPGSGAQDDPAEKTLLDDLLIHNIAPLEIALYLGEGGNPQGLLAAQFDYRDNTRFLAFAQAIADALGGEHQGDGSQGRITLNDRQIAYRYDAKTGKHWWLVGQQLPEKTDWPGDKPTPSASLVTASAQIDPQGQGFMIWLHNNPLLLSAASGEHSAITKALQLLKLKSLSGGYAIAADGKPTLQFNLEITPGGLRDFFPAQAPALDIAIHGDLESALAFTLPDNAGMQKILRILDQISGQQNSYANLKNKAQNTLNLDIEPLFNAFGTQWHILNDDFGQIYAIRKNEHWQTALDTLAQAGYLTLERNDDTGITHLRISLAQLIEEHLAKDDADLKHPLWQAILKAPTHIYYQEEGDHLIFADLPQPLIDRKRTTGGSHLGVHWSHAAQSDNNLLATLKIDHLARRHYYSRLQWLQYLADIAGTPIDIAALPSAQMLNLPEKSYLHAQIQSDPQNLRFKLIFENSILDPIHHQSLYNGATGIALLGILSAIALPAYDDYLERVNAAQHEAEDSAAPTLEEMSEADIAAIQSLIDTLHRDSAALRNTLTADNPLGESEQSTSALDTLQKQHPEIADIVIETGIYITFNDTAPAYLQHSELILWPSDSDPGVWHCYLNDPYLLGDTLLPPSCSPYDE